MAGRWPLVGPWWALGGLLVVGLEPRAFKATRPVEEGVPGGVKPGWVGEGCRD